MSRGNANNRYEGVRRMLAETCDQSNVALVRRLIEQNPTIDLDEPSPLYNKEIILTCSCVEKLSPSLYPSLDSFSK